jgi:hypothetical protein
MRRGVRAGVCTVLKHTYSLRDVAESAASEQNYAQSQCRCVKTQERAERSKTLTKFCNDNRPSDSKHVNVSHVNEFCLAPLKQGP